MSTTPPFQPTTPAASFTPNSFTATQSQSAGGWYNPFPNPYPYGFPTNGGNMYNPMMGGMNGGGMFGANPIAGNVYGSYDYQNNNPNSALPGYNYQSAIAPTSFTSPLSGNGVAPNSSGDRIYQEHFAESNRPLVSMASGAVGGFTAGALWMGTAGRVFRGARGGWGKFGNFCQLLAIGAGAVAGSVMGDRFMGDKLKAYYTGLDYQENGNMDGSYTSQRGYDVSLLKIL